MTTEFSGRVSYAIPAVFSAALILAFGWPYAARFVDRVSHPATVEAAPQPEDHFFRTSFDCHRARSTQALAICRDQSLAELDREMADLYGHLRLANPTLATDQRAWLSKRISTCGSDVECLRQWLTARRDALRAMSGHS